MHAYGYHACAVQNGGVKCWGNNNYGQVGDGSGSIQTAPVDVIGLTTGALDIGAGGEHSCALVSSGGVRCWGYGNDGTLGDGGTTSQPAPVTVLGLDGGVAKIDGIGFHSCALTSAGGAQCWGRGDFGQIGDGGGTNRTQATHVANLGGDVIAIAGGSYHSCAAVTGGQVFCWGRNDSGQVGDGTFTSRLLPVAVVEDDGSRQVAALTPAGDSASIAPASDASGRYLVFQSRAENLGPGNTASTSDIYRVDTESGAIELVSVNQGDAPMTADAIEPTISADGDMVAFVAADAGVTKVLGESAKTTRARAKAGGYSMIVRSLIAGTTQRIAIPALATGSTPQLAPSGNSLVYTAPNQGGGYGGGGATEIFKIPLIRSGGLVTPGAPQCVSCKFAGTDSDGDSSSPTISADGRYVAWETTAKNLAPGAPPCPNASTQIVFRDLLSGVSQRMGVPANAASCGAAGAGARKPKLDWPGRKLVFESDQPLKPGDANGLPDVYLVELGGLGLTRVSETAAGDDAGDESSDPVISGDGGIISYASAATNLDSGTADTNGRRDLHVFSLAQRITRRLSLNPDGQEIDADSQRPALNYNGTKLGFDSAANNLDQAAGPAGVLDVYQRANPFNSRRLFSAGFE